MNTHSSLRDVARLLDCIPTGLIIYTPDCRVIHTNAEADRLLGLGAGQSGAEEAPALSFVGADGAPLPADEHPARRVVASGLPIRDVTVGIERPAHGDRVWVQLSAFPERSEQQEIRQVVVSVLDVGAHGRTERVLQSNNERLSLALAAANAATWEWDLRTNENIWSDELWQLYGLAPHSCKPSYEAWLQTVHPDDRDGAVQAVQEAARAGTELNAEWRVCDHDGTERWLLSRGRPLRDQHGAIVRFIGIVLDITDRRRAEEALRQSEDKFARAFHSSPAALLLTRLADGCFIELNDAYCAVVGYARDELIGRRTTDFDIYIASADRQAIIDRLLKTGSTRNLEARIRHRSGDVRDVFANQELITFNGEACILSIFLDITERKQLERSLHTAFERFQIVLASLYGGMLVIHDDERVAFANQAFCDMFAIDEPPAALHGCHEMAVLARVAGRSVDGAQALGRMQAIVASGQPVRAEEISIQGERTYLRDFIPIVIDGAQHGRVWHHLDITAQKRAEQALDSERRLLAQRVAERTADLSVANAELVRALRVKDEFLSSMSHELRTPLNVILGRAELLQEGIYGELGAQQRRAVTSIDEAGQHLLNLISDILDLSKAEAGRLSLDTAPLDIAMVCDAAVRMVAQLAASKRIDLVISYDGRADTVAADERRLKQILVNLLSNAVKFTPDGGRVGLEVRLDPAQQAVVFSVWDDGIGVSPEDHQRIFLPFVQIDSSLSRQYEGTGLGLALVLRLTELLGGSVTLESSPGQGSRFSVALPQAAPAAPGSPPAQPAPGSAAHPPHPGARRSHVLLADDNEANVGVLADYLGGTGYEVLVARNGVEAVERALEHKPVLIVMDIQMPVLDGLDAIRRIRAAGLRDLPIIAVTALAMPGDRERCLAAGATAYLAKPVSMRSLGETIRSLL